MDAASDGKQLCDAGCTWKFSLESLGADVEGPVASTRFPDPIDGSLSGSTFLLALRSRADSCSHESTKAMHYAPSGSTIA